MIAGRWFITPHAVKRYQRRCGGPPRYEDALSELIKLSDEAHFVKDKDLGIELWRTGKPLRMRMYVSIRGEGLPQLVTVLRGSDHGG